MIQVDTNFVLNNLILSHINWNQKKMLGMKFPLQPQKSPLRLKLITLENVQFRKSHLS